IGNLVGQVSIGSRINNIHAGGQYSDGAAMGGGCRQCALVGSGIDACCQTATDAPASCAQKVGKFVGITFACSCGIACANHGQGRALEQLQITFGIEQQWRVMQVV